MYQTDGIPRPRCGSFARSADPSPTTAARRPTRWSRCRGRRPGPGRRPGRRGATAARLVSARSEPRGWIARARRASRCDRGPPSGVVDGDVARPVAEGTITGPSAGYGGIRASVSRSPIFASARRRKTSVSKLPPRFHDWTFAQATGIERRPWLPRHSPDRRRSPSRPTPRLPRCVIEPGIDARAIGVQRLAHLGRRSSRSRLRGLPPGEHPDEPIGLHLGRPEQLRRAGPRRCGARPPSATSAPAHGRSPGPGTGRGACRL